eukprot:gnl/TRDRNA2_/TRDRNA2_185104_c0_seq1.p1 gnl/TRDRNA2_/TRDRNA2_185104_c0~~gnl/TRDRNA2_/TRDRNA2_185104_c0_seq1.p1  ORF type:complete len:673 (-),score=189.34 gnl/TRDRNA2_/TRDRNA2_185104_c0_seq1:154-2112(-)
MAPSKMTENPLVTTMQAKKQPTTGKDSIPTGPGRVKNGAQLRAFYLEMKRAPDGIDPVPLTIPNCVECAHCGWPVWPRDAKVADKRTYARAGLDRRGNDPKKKAEEEKKAKKAAMGSLKTLGGGTGAKAGADDDDDIGDLLEQDKAGDDDDDDSDADSRDTMEKLEDRVEALTEEMEAQKEKINDLEIENKELANKLKETEEKLEEKLERIEYLEESEERWREKCSEAREQIAEKVLYIDRQAQRREDIETALVCEIALTRQLREKIAREKRRKAKMLEKMAERLGRMNSEETESTIFGHWRTIARTSALERRLAELEEIRRRQVLELNRLISIERTIVKRLKGRLVMAGHKLLQRAFGTGEAAKPWIDGWAFRAWAGAQPALQLTNRLEEAKRCLQETREALAETKIVKNEVKAKLREREDEYLQIESERDGLKIALNLLQGLYAKTAAELQVCKDLLAADPDMLERIKKKAAAEAVAACQVEMRAQFEVKMKEMEEKWNNQRARLDKIITELEEELETAKRKLIAAGFGDDSCRVVPKGQGVLCVGCCKQLVHRSVAPLPPVELQKSQSSPFIIEEAKRAFFDKELDGMPNPDDALHTAAWQSARDPWGLSKLKYSNKAPLDTGLSSARVTARDKRLSPLMKDFKPVTFR